jgi:hypothetical protein
VFIQGGGKEARLQGLEGAEVIFEDNGEEQDEPHCLESASEIQKGTKVLHTEDVLALMIAC